MILRYTKITGGGYIEGSDEWEEWGDDFDYEIDFHEELDALCHIILDVHFSNVAVLNSECRKELLKSIKSMILQCDDALEYYERIYEDEIWDYFKDEAFESLNNE